MLTKVSQIVAVMAERKTKWIFRKNACCRPVLFPQNISCALFFAKRMMFFSDFELA